MSYELRDGVLYPAKDVGLEGCNHTIEDLDDHIFPLIENKGIAIQAGGSVGLWPKKMAALICPTPINAIIASTAIRFLVIRASFTLRSSKAPVGMKGVRNC